MNVPNFRYRNLFWCLLLGKPIVYARKILDWPKFALFVVIWQNYIYHSFCFFDLLLLYFIYLVFVGPRRSRPRGLRLVCMKPRLNTCKKVTFSFFGRKFKIDPFLTENVFFRAEMAKIRPFWPLSSKPRVRFFYFFA